MKYSDTAITAENYGEATAITSGTTQVDLSDAASNAVYFAFTAVAGYNYTVNVNNGGAAAATKVNDTLWTFTVNADAEGTAGHTFVIAAEKGE